MSTWSPDAWLDAWTFASVVHQGQLLPGSQLPYIVHIAAVAMEVAGAISLRALSGDPVADPDLAITVALLHDTVEDTDTTVEEVAARFGPAVAAGVSALSKNPAVGDKPAQMQDSLARIREQPREVWMVKLADRINNLEEPPGYWTPDKIRRYGEEAGVILATLGEACPILAPRLRVKIAEYEPHARRGS